MRRDNLIFRFAAEAIRARCILGVGLAAIIFSGALCSTAFAIPDDVKAIYDSLKAVETDFEVAAADSDVSALEELKSDYREIKRNIEADPQLKQQLDYILHMCEYKLGWCSFYQYECSGDITKLSEAQRHFDNFSNAAPDSIALLGAYMSAETQFFMAEHQKYSLFTEELSPDDPVIRNLWRDARNLFKKVADNSDEWAGFLNAGEIRACADIRACDIDNELARLTLFQEGADAATVQYDTTCYESAIADISPPRELDSLVEYSDLCIHQNIAMLRRDQSVLADICNELDRFSTIPGSNIRYALATIAGGGDLQEVIRRLDASSQTDNLIEAKYWLGRSHIIDTNFQAAKSALTEFRDAVDEGDPRLGPLRQRAKRVITLISFAYGEDVSPDQLGKLTYEDVKIIFRILALAPAWQLNRIVSIVEPIFKRPELFEQGEEAALFFHGVLLSFLGEAADAENERTSKFREAADTLAKVSGDCALEAKYIRGRALFFAGDHDEARDILQSLVNDNGSLRALFYIGEIYRESESFVQARSCYDRILEALGDKSEYPDFQFWKTNARDGNRLCQFPEDNSDYRVDMALSGIRYPDHLCFLTEDEAITYETLAKFEVIREKFAVETVREFLIWGLPMLILHPDPVQEQAVIPDRYWSAYSAPIPARIPLNQKWNLCLTLIGVDNRQGLSGVTVLGNDAPMEFSGRCYAKNDIAYNEKVMLRISVTRYYTEDNSVSAQWFGDYDTTLALARTISYAAASRPIDHLRIYQRDSLGPNTVLIRKEDSPEELPEALLRDFQTLRSLRDFVYDPTRSRFIAVDAALENGILTYGAEDKSGEKLTLSFGASKIPRLNSPEGIAVDSKGNLYVVDWGHHRIVVFDGSGKYITEFGEEGRNSSPNSGNPAKLTFPTRIAVEEDREGITSSGGDRLFRQGHVLVADRYGIHKFDGNGHYLDSPIVSDVSGRQHGKFYDLYIDGYGAQSAIHVIDIREGGLVSYEPIR